YIVAVFDPIFSDFVRNPRKDLSKRLYPERGDDSKAVLAKIREFNRLYYVSSSRARQRILVIR
ncbi:hypothetical protein, partial [Nostoc sp. ChiQUE01b]|uniref:hypothetical protein n=1 Tax=Nostoc sp. ChiQUE01b TaxID=3075376 RepID=UPI002AD54635